VSATPNVKDSRVERVEQSSSRVPMWWLMFTRELTELWVGGKALVLLLIYSIMLGGITYVLASNSELSLIPQNEMVYETLKTAIAVALFMGLIIGADSLSGERERSTLESLLLTPVSRRGIVAGKFLAAISVWPAAFLITIPYLTVLGKGDEVVGPAVIAGALLGSVLAIAYTGLGMFVSFWCNTNKTSYFVNLGIYILVLVPAQLPGRAQTGVMGQFLQWVNPLAAANHFLSKILVNNQTVADWWTWLLPPVVFALLMLGLLLVYAAPGLRLEGGRASLMRSFWVRVSRVTGLGVFLVACLLTALQASPAMALHIQSHPAVQPTDAEQTLQVSVDMAAKLVKATDSILFNTSVTNKGTDTSAPLILAMNIINLNAEGEIVDPEDWSPQRTQYIEQLAPGQSAMHSWRVNAILDGDYMVYLVAIPQPGSQDATSHPVASPGIHLMVTPYTRLNPAGILPFAIGGPILLGLCAFLVYRYRRRKTDEGGA
jgi:ABC-2 family transporter protein